MTALEQMTREHLDGREKLRMETRRSLRFALQELLPLQPAIVFGSLLEPGKFSDVSDVDIALWQEPADMTIYQLTSLLAERLDRRVDVLLLPDCRFRERIMREGEIWTP